MQRRQLNRRIAGGFTLLEMLVVIVILAILMAILLPQFLHQNVKAKDDRAKSYLTLAWESLTSQATADESSFASASQLAGQLRFDQPQLSSQVVSDCSQTTMASFDDKKIVLVGPQTNGAALVMCVRSSSGNIYELIAPVSGADPTIVLVGSLSGKPPVNIVSPAISGDARAGQRLTGQEGGWESDPPPTYSYQWQRCNANGGSCVNISGATSSSYLVLPGDIGSSFNLQVTATNPYGSATATASTTTQATHGALAGAPANTSAPQISGPAAQGQTVTADRGIWTGTAPISYSYQWQDSANGGSSWTNIAGATSVTYQIAAAEVGKTLRVEVDATNSAGEALADSTATSQVIPPPVNTSAPAIGGSAQDSQTLTVTNGGWQYAPTGYSYQWQYSANGGSSWTNIAGATNSSYQIPYSTYDGDQLRAQVTATNAAGLATASSGATTAVVPIAPSNTAAPSIGGTAQVGQTLTGTQGTWQGTPTINYTYQWQTSPDGSSGWSNLSGATSISYSPQESDAGNYLRIQVTATNAAGSTWAASTATSQVLGSIPVGAVVPYAGKTPLPSGWALADGSCGYSSGSYPDLYAAIGTTYGGTSGNFCLPDMRGRFALGKAIAGTGSSLGASGGALDQSGSLSPFGAITENYSWSESPPSPAPIGHSHSMPGSGHLSNNQWPNFTAWQAQNSTTGSGCCGTGSPVDSLASASETWTANSTGTLTGSATFTPSATYSVSNPPYTTVRYVINLTKSSVAPCGGLWGYGGSAAPSGAQLANGGSGTGTLSSCLDSAFGGNLPNLQGHVPVGLATSGSASTLAGAGGSIDQTVNGSLTAASTQASVSVPGWSASLTENGHSHSYNGSQVSAGAGGNANGNAAGNGAPSVSNNSNSGSAYSSNVFSPGALTASGAGAQSPVSSSFNTAFETVNWVAYTVSSYSPAAGTLSAYAGSSAPNGWLLTDGSCYPTSTYPALFSAIGYTYGGSAGNFCVPDLRGRFALGKAASGTGSTLGVSGGSLNPAPQLSFSGWTPQITVPGHAFSWSVPAHTHTVTFFGNNTLGNAGGFIGSLRFGTDTSGSAGGGTVSSSVSSYAVNASSAVGSANASPAVQPPPYLALNTLIKT